MPFQQVYDVSLTYVIEKELSNSKNDIDNGDC